MGDRAVRWVPLALVGAAFAWMVGIAAAPIHDPDSWWHLRLGNDLIGQRSLAAPAHWSSFATVSWTPTEPLPEIWSALVQRVLGLPGLAVLFGVTLMLVVASVQVTNRREAALLPASIATFLAVTAATLSLTPRPQLVSFILLPIVLGAWLQTERDLRARWWLVPLVWFWSLCHGFWIFGVVVGAVFVTGIALSRRTAPRTLLRLGGVAVASLLVVTLNPAGLGVVQAPFVARASRQYVREWQQTDLLMGAPLAVILMIGITVAVWALTRQGVSWSRVLLLVVCAGVLWYAERLVVLAGLMAAPLFAHALDGVVARRASTSLSAGRIGHGERLTLAAMAGVCLVVLAVLARATSDRPGGVPLGLDPALDRLPAGTRVFNAYYLGGWLTWRHPDLDQYIDGSITPYPEEQVADYVRADSLETGWYGVVRSSGAGVALLDDEGALARALERRGWTASGTSAGYVLLEAPHRPS